MGKSMILELPHLGAAVNSKETSSGIFFSSSSPVILSTVKVNCSIKEIRTNFPYILKMAPYTFLIESSQIIPLFLNIKIKVSFNRQE